MEQSKLETWIEDYLLWMVDKGHSSQTIDSHERILKYFVSVAKKLNWTAESAIQQENRTNFLSDCPITKASPAITGFADYLEKRGILEKSDRALPEIFEHYMVWYRKTRQISDGRLQRIRKMLWEFHDWLQIRHMQFESLTINHVDEFLKFRNQGLAPRTCAETRGIIKGLLRYLHIDKNLLKRDLGSLIVSAPVFAYEIPPKYLRKNEICRLFDAMDLITNDGLRTHAMTRLAYTTGLRPGEIARMRLEDISFAQGELTVPERKGLNPVRFPLPEDTVKAIAAYIIGARPKIKERRLFVSLSPPYVPVSGGLVSDAIKKAMQRADIPGTPYWLRHTYAQNLLESGASIFEIKEMLGHDCFKATKRYLHIHIKLMREVLFDD